VILSGCGGVANCPVCGTTQNGAYGVIDIIPVPEHNPTGEPGGPFNSFDISLMDPAHHTFFVSDRIGLDVVMVNTQTNIATNFLSGDNGVAGAGDLPSPCIQTAAGVDIIPPLVTGLGNFTRFACRTNVPGGIPFHIPGFGSSTHLGGFPGAQCCAARANGVNPLSAPDGEALTADGNTLFIGNGSSSVVVFAMEVPATPNGTGQPVVVADIPTGFSPDYDGCTVAMQPCGPANNGLGTFNPTGIAPCIASANGRAFADPTCGDLRADEMSYDEKDHILLVTNGDPGFPFATLIDMSAVVARTGNCLPTVAAQPYMIQIGTVGGAPIYNNPTCILGQIYYDGAGQNNINVAVDDINGNSGGAFPCPDPSTTAPSGASGHNALGAGVDVPCHHGPIVSAAVISSTSSTPSSVYCPDQTNTTNPGSLGCAGAISFAGLGGSAFNPNSGRFLVTNGNAYPSNLAFGTVDVINPNIGNPDGPFVENSFLMPNCMPTSIVQGPGNNFLVGCADHDGEAFPPNEYVIDGTSGKILATIDNVGGVDETWYNPTDNRYYLAARDMPTGPVLGVIDAKTNLWLVNVTTNSNSHSIAVDPSDNHVFVPMQAGTICTTQSANGCIGVFAQQ